MHEMRDLAQEEVPEFEPRSRTVSFPDHYLLPYIEWCKNSKPVTCACSIIFIGLAIFCFFSTNYIIDYPVTESRKIAFVFAAIACIICAVTCLELRFKILKQCREGPEDNVQFEIVRRDPEFSAASSFSRHFEMQETLFTCDTPIGEMSRTDIPDDSFTVVQSADETYVSDISPYKYSDHGRLPRHSISDGLPQDNTFLPLLKTSKLSSVQNGISSKQLQNVRTTSGYDNNPLNYSTFEKESNKDETIPLLVQLTFDKESDEAETMPLLVQSTFENEVDKVETMPLLGQSTFAN